VVKWAGLAAYVPTTIAITKALSKQLHKTFWAHKVWTVVAIVLVIAAFQFLVLGVGLGSGDSGMDTGPITTGP